MFNWSYRKIGGIHFVRIGRLGFTFFLSRQLPQEFRVA